MPGNENVGFAVADGMFPSIVASPGSVEMGTMARGLLTAALAVEASARTEWTASLGEAVATYSGS